MLSIIQDIIGARERNKTPPYHAPEREVLAEARRRGKHDPKGEINDLCRMGKITWGREINQRYFKTTEWDGTRKRG